ncbi:MAG: glycosyltransferase family 2 protein [Desulfovibrio sp.]|nr:glycosyltransferase family 2 protein [Desulfovibrio sp.]
MKPLLESKDVTVLIVNYRGADDTINCLRSLDKLVEVPGRIIVIDNNSNDGSVDKIFFAWREFASPSIVKAQNIGTTDLKYRSIILTMPKNGGYAYGNNAGMRLAFRDNACKAVWVLNNDTEADTRALYELCKKVYTEKCIVGSTLVYHHDKKTVQCLGGSKVNKFLGTTSHICEGMNIKDINILSEYDIEYRLDAINGASMLIPKNIIHKTGFINEKFFMYYEDIEFCQRAKNYYINILWSKHSIVYHNVGSTIITLEMINKQNKRYNNYIYYTSLRNRIYYTKLLHSIYLPFVCFSYIFIVIKNYIQLRKTSIYKILIAMNKGLSM